MSVLVRLGLPADPRQATPADLDRVDDYLEAVRLAVVELCGTQTDRVEPVAMDTLDADLAVLMPWLREARIRTRRSA
jgi:hypothetical protein